MQNRRHRTITESVMLCPTCQTSWVMENLHDKSGTLQGPDIFAVDMVSRVTQRATREVPLVQRKHRPSRNTSNTNTICGTTCFSCSTSYRKIPRHSLAQSKRCTKCCRLMICRSSQWKRLCACRRTNSCRRRVAVGNNLRRRAGVRKGSSDKTLPGRLFAGRTDDETDSIFPCIDSFFNE